MPPPSLRSLLTVVQAGVLAGLSFMVCLLLFGAPCLGIQTSDDAATLAAAVAWWERGSPAISHMRWLNERVEIGHEGRDGELYAKYGMGQIGLGDSLLAHQMRAGFSAPVEAWLLAITRLAAAAAVTWPLFAPHGFAARERNMNDPDAFA